MRVLKSAGNTPKRNTPKSAEANGVRISHSVSSQRSWPAYRTLPVQNSVFTSSLRVQPSNHPLDHEADEFSATVVGRSPLLSGHIRRPLVAPTCVSQTIREAGKPLDDTSRRFFEARMQRDLSEVRIHTGHLADLSTRSLSAAAYTIGNHIVFRDGLLSPLTVKGRGLLAHELAHVAQQADGRTANIQCQDLPEQVIPGSTHLSRVAQAYRRDNTHVGAQINLVAVEYSTGDGPRQTRVFENRSGVAHTEVMMDEFFRRQGRNVQIHEIYSERQPCGPSEQDCEARVHRIVRRRGRRGSNGEPETRTTYGYQYQEAVRQGGTRARRSRERISESAERTRTTGNLEWDFPRREPPAHHERSEGGAVTRRSRRFRARSSSNRGTQRGFTESSNTTDYLDGDVSRQDPSARRTRSRGGTPTLRTRRLRIPISSIRHSRRGSPPSGAAGGVISLIAAFLAGWVESAVDGHRLSSTIEARLPARLNRAIESNESLYERIRMASATMQDGHAYVEMHAIVEAEYSSESYVVWQDIEETPPMLDEVRVTGFSETPTPFVDLPLSRTEPQFNVFEERSIMRFSMPLEFEQSQSQPQGDGDNDTLRQQLSALGMPIPDLPQTPLPRGMEQGSLESAADQVQRIVNQAMSDFRRQGDIHPNTYIRIRDAWPAPYNANDERTIRQFQHLLLERNIILPLTSTIIGIIQAR
ncbi:DUF4157 domain-containing protein [Enterovibrio sp. ZSDZ35]|uniref:DUF4157 domain-containing protein n=1 Tax=Enterovibrio qingdaonensis TaxID=2899818 RepID=A0ABT5QLQ8_9GAMM|nr:DUF4157 domain-containing protein [Enterovibrio sp. ZSDZ35]MDD1781916.1 DUF4157 domain-containing protein [Enterovibrio sp. ZSDZ35]